MSHCVGPHGLQPTRLLYPWDFLGNSTGVGCHCLPPYFLKEFSSLSHSIVFLYFFALIAKEAFLIFPCYSLELCIQMGISFLFSFAFHFSSFHSFSKASSDSHFAFLPFFFLGMVLIPVSCTMSWISVHSSPGTLSIRSLKSISHFHCIIIRDLIQAIPEWSSGFPYFLQFKSEFGNKEFMIWATVSSRPYFCWFYRVSQFLAARNIINLILVLTIWWCPCVESSFVLLEESVCYHQCVLLAKLC